MTKTTVIISDTQVPYEDKKAMQAVIAFIGAYQPDEVVHIGDVVDFPAPARWSKGGAEEFKGGVLRDAQYTKDKLLAPLRAVYSGPIGLLEGNHDLRPRDYLAKNAPALAGSNFFDFEQLLDFDGFGITKLPEFYEFAPRWIMTHGHRGVGSLSRVAGTTALNAAKNLGVSVIMGHTHRLGISNFSRGYGQKVHETLTGMEVGNLMDMTKAHYLKGKTANWQQGFGVVHQHGNHVQANAIAINKGKFTVDGQTFSIADLTRNGNN